MNIIDLKELGVDPTSWGFTHETVLMMANTEMTECHAWYLDKGGKPRMASAYKEDDVTPCWYNADTGEICDESVTKLLELKDKACLLFDSIYKMELI